MVKEPTRAEVADIFHNKRKLSKFYRGHVPVGLNMSDIRARLKTHTKAGKWRKGVKRPWTFSF